MVPGENAFGGLHENHARAEAKGYGKQKNYQCSLERQARKPTYRSNIHQESEALNPGLLSLPRRNKTEGRDEIQEFDVISKRQRQEAKRENEAG